MESRKSTESLEEFHKRWRKEILENPFEYPNLFEIERRKNIWYFER